MGTASWVIPIASLAAICGVAILFVWWWFPRAWKKGTQKDIDMMVAERAARERYLQQRNEESGETEEGAQNADAPKQPPKPFVYTPPAYTSY